MLHLQLQTTHIESVHDLKQYTRERKGNWAATMLLLTKVVIPTVILALAAIGFGALSLSSPYSTFRFSRDNPNYVQMFYTKAKMCRSRNDCVTVTIDQFLSDSTGCGGFAAGSDAAFAFCGIALILVGVAAVMAVVSVCFPHTAVLRLSVLGVLSGASASAFMGYMIAIALQYSIKCRSWSGPLSSRRGSKAESAIQLYSVTTGSCFIVTILWAVLYRRMSDEISGIPRLLRAVELQRHPDSTSEATEVSVDRDHLTKVGP